jgi:uncharacterized protein
VKYFLDTYALIEILHGNPKYLKYTKKELFTTKLNLYELYYNLLRDFSKEKAKELFFQFADFIIDVKDEYIFSAAQFKREHRKKGISYCDALGYAIADTEGMRFLTGDKEFKCIENVEFVPK